MIDDDGIGGGQAQAAALLFGGKIRIEYPLQVLRRHANALVGDGDLHIAAFLEGK